MPRLLDIPKELETVRATLRSDPTFRFTCVTRIAAPTYKRILEDCQNNSRTLSVQIEDICKSYYALTDDKQMGLEDNTAEAVRNLSILWNCSFEEAARRTLDRTVVSLLQSEVEDAEAVAAAGKKVKSLSGTPSGHK